MGVGYDDGELFALKVEVRSLRTTPKPRRKASDTKVVEVPTQVTDRSSRNPRDLLGEVFTHRVPISVRSGMCMQVADDDERGEVATSIS